MYLTIITLPLLGSIAAGLFGRKTGISGAHIITTTCIVVTTILAIVAFFEVGLNNTSVSINLIRWVESESLNVLWGFEFDSLTVSMLIPVLIVSSLVHIYSIGYMSHDPHQQRFFSYLSLFTFMMIILVTTNSYILMFVGWEGVGVCSYLLVSFWFTRIAANQSSISAFLTNRVGDCFLTIGMFAILWSFGNVDYSTVFSLAPFVNENIVTIIGICLLIGAMAKSSQVGLHVWLPMAMEGPTPVSALIHAATMVTAGVYLLIRSSPLIEYSSTALLLCLWLGAITTVFSSLIGLFQQDIKKVIAYSTMSQLGLMVIAVGLSSYNVALFHLVNHAFYKALLFLGAGSVIHAVSDNQDFRKYGGLRRFLPLTYSVMLIASLSLAAFPFMTGFYSKDFILESAYGGFTYSGVVVYYIATIGAIFTTLYSVKVLYLTFLANPNGSIKIFTVSSLTRQKVKCLEGEISMNLPLIILAVFSIFFGYITKEIFIGLASDFFSDNSIFIHANNEIMLDTEFAVSTIFKLLPFIFTVLFIIYAVVVSEYLTVLLMRFKFSRIGYKIFTFFNQRFFIELIYNKYISGLIYFKLAKQTSLVLDKGTVELLGPFGLEKSLLVLSRNINNLSTGIVTNYALYILMGLIFYMSLPFLTKYDTSLFIFSIFSFFSIIACGHTYRLDSRDSTNPTNPTNPGLNKQEIDLKPNIAKIISGFGPRGIFNYINFFKHFSFKNIFKGLLIIFFVFILKSFGLTLFDCLEYLGIVSVVYAQGGDGNDSNNPSKRPSDSEKLDKDFKRTNTDNLLNQDDSVKDSVNIEEPDIRNLWREKRNKDWEAWKESERNSKIWKDKRKKDWETWKESERNSKKLKGKDKEGPGSDSSGDLMTPLYDREAFISYPSEMTKDLAKLPKKYNYGEHNRISDIPKEKLSKHQEYYDERRYESGYKEETLEVRLEHAKNTGNLADEKLYTVELAEVRRQHAKNEQTCNTLKDSHIKTVKIKDPDNLLKKIPIVQFKWDAAKGVEVAMTAKEGEDYLKSEQDMAKEERKIRQEEFMQVLKEEDKLNEELMKRQRERDNSGKK